MTEPEIKLWLEALHGYSVARIAEAFKAHMRDEETCQWFPLEGQIIGRLKPAPAYQRPFPAIKAEPDCSLCGDLGFVEAGKTEKGDRLVTKCKCKQAERMA